MTPQHLAEHSSSAPMIAATRSQPVSSEVCGYLFAGTSPILTYRYTQGMPTSRGSGGGVKNRTPIHKCDRRLRCQRASNWLPPSASPHLQLHAVVARRHRLRWKNSSWLNPRRFPSSQYTQASTSKLVWGQALAPVPTRAQIVSAGDVSWR